MWAGIRKAIGASPVQVYATNMMFSGFMKLWLAALPALLVFGLAINYLFSGGL